MAPKSKTRSKKDQAQFIVYQPNPKEFCICLEAGTVYYIWSGNYPPTQDNRFARKVTRLKAIIPKQIPNIYDKGTYTVNKDDDKADTEKKLKEGVKKKSFSFILNGKRLKGRFIIKQTSAGTVLQKFKDKYAKEEDVLGRDLTRTISLMVPDYDPDSVKLHAPKRTGVRLKPEKEKVTKDTEEQPAEEITADKEIGNTEYHFAFYSSDNEPDLCVISNARNEVLVLQKNKDRWQLLKALKGSALKKEKELVKYAQALRHQQDQ
ncbi:hypothetical protein A8C56_03410 [Niabella ginsenosidivorans]|uniref:Uncharacterized protein n=1 Tax=Niabella ginsenosidivorans TaxID=1176587 RepID=A0A1A9I0A3_9BACT|nr:hypothetical protein [Niabella ginsenosidivorans]ANH80160.1 hypothetical protein A8C56_03410 [Niabella ginsenosidivorans]